MFFGRIYGWGRTFEPSWRSYAAYAAIIALALLAIEFGVLNVLPDNTPGSLLLIVPAFYVLVALVFLVSDAVLALWRWFRAHRPARGRTRSAPAKPRPAPKPRGMEKPRAADKGGRRKRAG